MNNIEKIEALKRELEMNPKIILDNFYTDDPFTKKKIRDKLDKALNVNEGERIDLGVSENFLEMAASVNGLNLSWHSSKFAVVSNIEFYSLTRLVFDHVNGFWKDKIWFDNMPKKVKADIQKCPVFDWFDGGRGQGACLRIKENVITDEVWRYDMYAEDKVYPMGVSLQRYFDLMIECKGFQGWQDAFYMKHSEARKKFEEKFPLIFPDVDMEKLLAKFSKD